MVFEDKCPWEGWFVRYFLFLTVVSLVVPGTWAAANNAAAPVTDANQLPPKMQEMVQSQGAQYLTNPRADDSTEAVPQTDFEWTDASVAAGPDSGRTTLLHDAVALAVSRHPEILTVEHERRAAHRGVAEERAPFFPELEFFAAGGREYSRNSATVRNGFSSRYEYRQEGRLTFRQKIFDGLETWNRVQSAKASAASAEESLVGAGHAIGLTATAAYLDVLRNRALSDVAHTNFDVHQNVFGSIRKRVDQGVDRSSELDQAQARLEMARSHMESRDGGARMAGSRYLEVIGVHPGVLVPPLTGTELELPNLGAALEVAQSRNPAVRIAQAELDARQAEIGAERNAFMPDIDLEVSAFRGRNLDGVAGNEYDAAAMVMFRYDLFKGGANRARYGRTKEQATAAEQELAAAKRDARENVRLAYHEIETSLRRLEPLQRRVAASRRVANAYQKQWEMGQRSLFILLDQQHELFLAESALIDEEYSLLFAHYSLLAHKGELLTQLGLTDQEGFSPNRLARRIAPDIPVTPAVAEGPSQP